VKFIFIVYSEGGHLNPAVSFGFLIQGRLSLLRYLVYTVAQNLGAFLAALMVYLSYINELHGYMGGMYSFDTAGKIHLLKSYI